VPEFSPSARPCNARGWPDSEGEPIEGWPVRSGGAWESRFAASRLGREAPTSEYTRAAGAIAQMGERLLCKQEVTGSIPVGSIQQNPCIRPVLRFRVAADSGQGPSRDQIELRNLSLKKRGPASAPSRHLGAGRVLPIDAAQLTDRPRSQAFSAVMARRARGRRELLRDVFGAGSKPEQSRHHIAAPFKPSEVER
jgi:hypothetical protein